MMEDFANQIRKLRRERGLNQAGLGELLGVNQATVSRWESGSIPEPQQLARLAELAGVSLQDFIGGDLGASRIGPALFVKGEVAAGVWQDAWQWEPEEWKAYQGGSHIAAPDSDRFGLAVVGESMNEVYPPGTILDCVNIHNTADLKSGQRVIVIRKQFGDGYEATVKEYRQADGKDWLIPRSNNPSFQTPIDLSVQEEGIEEVAIVAIVCGSYRPEI